MLGSFFSLLHAFYSVYTVTIMRQWNFYVVNSIMGIFLSSNICCQLEIWQTLASYLFHFCSLIFFIFTNQSNQLWCWRRLLRVSWTARRSNQSRLKEINSHSCPLSWWWHPKILSSVAPFSSCPQSFPASRSFPMSWFFASGSQSIGASASASVLPMNIQNWFPLGLTGLISLQSKGLSSVFSSTTVQKHQFFGVQPSLWPNSHIHTWLLEKP